MVSYIQPADVAAVVGFKEDGNMNEKNTKAVGWFFMILGIAYLINPFDVPGPIDDVLAMSAGTILKIVFDIPSREIEHELLSSHSRQSSWNPQDPLRMSLDKI